jgi:glycosyltransferase involved in cell wall biosynthesis
MHLLLIHQAFAALDEPGGTRHHEIARFLAASGHRVTVIASPISYLTGESSHRRVLWKKEYIDDLNITIIRAYTYRALHKSFIHRVFSFLTFMLSSFLIGLSIKEVDIIWGTSPPIFQAGTAWLLARLKRARFLLEIRDLWPEFAVSVGVLTDPLLIKLAERFERFLYRHADTLMVNSPGFIDHIQARGGKDIKLIPNGADSAMFDPQADGAGFRAAHGLENKFVVMYAGAHGLSNDLGVLLEAAQRLREQGHIAFAFVGDGKDKPALQIRAAELNLSNVVFIPPVPKAGMAEALAAADACVAILKPIEIYKTVYPNKVFDYLAAGRPIVMAVDGVAREIVEAAGAGRFAQPGNPVSIADVILEFAIYPVAARQMGHTGREYLEKHFDRNKLSVEFEALIQELHHR